MTKAVILHILGSKGLWGAESIAAAICLGMGEEYDMIYISPDGPVGNLLKNMGVRYEPIDRLNACSIRRKIKAFKPDIIHAHDNRASVFSSAATLLCREKPYLISHVHNSFPYLKKPGILRFTDRIMRPRYDENIFCSNLTHSYYKKYAPYYSKLKNCRVMENFTDIEKNQARAEEENPLPGKKVFTIGFVGRLEPQKGMEEFLLALRKFNHLFKADVNIHILGMGSLEGTLRKIIEESPDKPRVRLEGYCENPISWMKTFDLMILPSRYEGLPLTVLEAMSVGTPVLAMNVGALSETITDGVDGWLVEQGNYEGFIRKLSYLIENSNDVAIASKLTVEKVMGKYDKGQYIQRLSDIYNDALRKR